MLPLRPVVIPSGALDGVISAGESRPELAEGDPRIARSGKIPKEDPGARSKYPPDRAPLKQKPSRKAGFAQHQL